MIKKTEKGYMVDIRPNGREGRRFRKTLASMSEARAYEKYIIAKYQNPEEWHRPEDNRCLSELVTLWFDLHGKQLKSGAKRLTELNKAVDLLGDPKAKDFTAAMYTDFRAKRLKDVSANTANHDLTNLRSLFNELDRLGEWPHANPVAKVRKIKTDEQELSYLTLDQISTLLAELDKSPSSHARISARICLATGARWSEAATVKASQVANGRITYSGTKNGKNRSVPISPDLCEMVRTFAPLIDGMNTFKRAVAKLDLNLPKGQMTHVLRHSFASHFMINGGNIVTLQRILGHGSIMMTMRYAHLSPEHLNEALALNPLTKIG
jgi:site-specific recombinase XerD